MLADIVRQGYQINLSESIESISYKFFNLRRRKIEVRPRNIYESFELKCPVEHSAGYEALKNKLANGDDVTPYLSNLIFDINFSDQLLNDWGIYHFHLGQEIESTGMINRTGPLLFALVTLDDIYCINIFHHNALTEQEMIRIIHRNWPEIIARFKLNGVCSLEHSVSNRDLTKLRKGGVQAMVEVETGVVYAPPGGGYSTSGAALRTIVESDNYKKMVCLLERHVRDNLTLFTDKLAELGLTPSNPPKFSLLINDSGFLALEKGSNCAFVIHRHEDADLMLT